jgi:hypothetical protein
VRVADGADPVGAGVGRAGEHSGDRLACFRRAAGDVIRVEDVDRPIEGAKDLGPARQIR